MDPPRHGATQRSRGERRRWGGAVGRGALLVWLLCLPVSSQGQDAPETVRSRPDSTCTGQAEGVACWMELANEAGCYVWNDRLRKDESVTWTGACAGSWAHGAGMLTWVWGENKNVSTATGLLQNGKQHGRWVLRRADGRVDEGPYVDGQQHGHWVVRTANGSVIEGPYVDGQQHGHWVTRNANGGVAEGPYVDGQQHGHWVFRFADGYSDEGPYVDGQRHGPWVVRDADGSSREVTYVNGRRQ